MNIEWNKVTWYSKALAVILFVAVFFIGFQSGSVYQQAKDYSKVSLYVESNSNTAGGQTSVTGVTTSTTPIPPTATHYNGLLICATNNGCPTGYSCLRAGPLIAGKQVPKVCVPSNQAVPL